MDKKEFLSLLRQALEGEVDERVIEQNILFYNEYISSQSDKSEEEVIKEIGDPRLIAKTIIESESSSSGDTGSNYDSYSSGSYDYSYNDSSSKHNKVYHVKWYHMLLVAIALLLVFSVLIRIGWMLLRLFFVFLLPIILITLLLSLFRKR